MADGDDFLAADAVLFVLACFLSFWSFNTLKTSRRQKSRLIVDALFMLALDTVRIGARVRLKVFRKGTTFTMELVITERPLQPGDAPKSSQSFSVRQEPETSNDKAQ